jgi:hypothetical protein
MDLVYLWERNFKFARVFVKICRKRLAKLPNSQGNGRQYHIKAWQLANFLFSSDIQGDRSKLKCLICDQVLEVDEENQSELVYDHFQSHPAELQKILWEKSQRKGFFSGFICPPFIYKFFEIMSPLWRLSYDCLIYTVFT